MTHPSEPSTASLSTDAVRAGRRAVVVLDRLGLRVLPLPEEGLVDVGAHPDAFIEVDELGVAERHVELDVGASGVRVTHLAARGETRVSGRALAVGESAVFARGVLLELGAAVLVLEGTDAVRPSFVVPRAAAANTRLCEPPQRSVMTRVLALARRVAPDVVPILLVGETGTGKELVAEQIHLASGRAAGPLVRLHCAAVPQALFESELFGHEQGAFTGAHAAKPGLLELASGGTAFIDEVAEMPLAVQAKLLRALEDGSIRRVGGRRELPLDVRFVAATNRDVDGEVDAGRLRADLLYRLDGFRLELPPLRDRHAEIATLAAHFAAEACAQRQRPPLALSDAAIAALEAHPWPGNVRELRNVVIQAVVFARGTTLDVGDLPLDEMARRAQRLGAVTASPDEATKLMRALEAHGFSQVRAAESLGISVRTLQNRMDTLGVSRPRSR